MKNRFLKAISLLISVLLIVSAIPLSVSADTSLSYQGDWEYEYVVKADGTAAIIRASFRGDLSSGPSGEGGSGDMGSSDSSDTSSGGYDSGSGNTDTSSGGYDSGSGSDVSGDYNTSSDSSYVENSGNADESTESRPENTADAAVSYAKTASEVNTANTSTGEASVGADGRTEETYIPEAGVNSTSGGSVSSNVEEAAPPSASDNSTSSESGEESSGSSEGEAAPPSSDGGETDIPDSGETDAPADGDETGDTQPGGSVDSGNGMIYVTLADYVNGYTVTELRSESIQIGSAVDNVYINLPSYLSKIQANTFSDADVDGFCITEENQYFATLDGAVYSKDTTKLLHFPKGRKDICYYVPEGTVTITSWAFKYSELKSVVLPSSLLYINAYAFCDATYLSDIKLPDSLISIGDGAFMGCENLNNVFIPESVTEIGEYAFDGGEKNIFAPEGSYALEYAAENGISAKASKEIKEITVTEYQDTIIEHTNGQYTNDWYNDVLYEWYRYHNIAYGEICVTYTDGTTAGFYDEFGFTPRLMDDQSYTNQWLVGETHSYYISVFGFTCELSVEIVEAPTIENLMVTPTTPTIIENTNGHIMNEPTSDGTTVSYWYYHIGEYNFLYSFSVGGVAYQNKSAEDVYQITGIRPQLLNGQSFNNQLRLGENTITISVGETQASAIVTILPTPEIENLIVTPRIPKIVQFSTGHYTTTSYEDGTVSPKFWYYEINEYNMNYSFTYNGIEWKDKSYYDVKNILGVEPMFVSPEQSYDNQLIVGINTFEMTVANAAASFDIEILPAPVVTDLIIEPVVPQMYVNTNGWEVEDNVNGVWVPFWHYEVDEYEMYYSFSYEGESYTKISYGEVYEILGIYPQWRSEYQSYNNQWGIGTHEFTIAIGKVEAQSSIEILGSPIRAIEVSSTSKPVYFKDGHLGSSSQGEAIFYHNYDLQYTVYLTDGTEKIFSSSDEIYEEFGIYPTINDNLEYWDIGFNTVEVSIFGVAAETQVEVVSGDVLSLELTSEVNTDYNWYALPNIDGYTFKVTYSDREFTHTVNLSESDYAEGNLYKYNMEGEILYYFIDYNDNGNPYLKLVYDGASLDVPLNIVENDIASVSFKKLPIDLDMTGTVITTVDKNGVSTDYTVKDIYDNRYNIGGGADEDHYYSYYETIMITDKGAFRLDYETCYNTDISTYEEITFWMFENAITVSGSNAAVIYAEERANDAIPSYSGYDKQAISVKNSENGNYLFSYRYYSEADGARLYTVEVNAEGNIILNSASYEQGDVNKDGNIDILDLVRLKRMMAQETEEEPIFADLIFDNVLNGSDLTFMVKKILNFVF